MAYKNNYEKWKCWDVAHYRYTSKYDYFGAYSCIIEVLDGEVVEADTVDALYNDHEYLCVGLSNYDIDKAFERIAKKFDQETPTFSFEGKDYYGYEIFIAEYDETYGYPTRVYLDPTKDVADEEYGLTIFEFERLE